MMAIRRANRPVMHEDGFAEGTITEMGERTYTKRTKNGRDIIDEDITSYVMVVDAKGVTGEPVRINMFAGLAVNDEPVETTGRGRQVKKRYNRFTTMCLVLGVLNEEELTTVDEARLKQVADDLTNMVGRAVQFKTRRKESGYFEIDVNTLELLQNA